MELDQYSDYGSGSSFNSFSQSSSWIGSDGDYSGTRLPRPKSELLDLKSSSCLDLVMGRCTLEDVMREFRMNGYDSPYSPDDERPAWLRHAREIAPEVGPLSGPAYLRQKSWPAAERPARARPHSLHAPGWLPPRAGGFATSSPVFDDIPPAAFVSEVADSFIPQSTLIPECLPRSTAAQEMVTAEQSLVLNSLPDRVLYSLLRGLQNERRGKMPVECRFCKNNGERESYYRSHSLKDTEGRVSCPVLRAFVCRRCGARGDRAHTIKYCPLSTNEERIKSTAMMRSVRMASGRRRHSPARPAPAAPAPPDAPLDPLWAALEHKLSM